MTPLALDVLDRLVYYKYMKTDTRQKLIRAGAKAMMTKSYNAVGIQEILTGADVPKGSFYYYFDTKEEFGVAVVEHYGQSMANTLQKRLSDSTVSPRTRLLNHFLSIRQYYVDNGSVGGCLVAKLANEIGSTNPTIREALQKYYDEWVELVARCIGEAQKAGEIDPCHDPNDLADFIYTSWQGALTVMLVKHNVVAIDKFIGYIFTFLLPEKEYRMSGSNA